MNAGFLIVQGSRPGGTLCCIAAEGAVFDYSTLPDNQHTNLGKKSFCRLVFFTYFDKYIKNLKAHNHIPAIPGKDFGEGYSW